MLCLLSIRQGESRVYNYYNIRNRGSSIIVIVPFSRVRYDSVISYEVPQILHGYCGIYTSASVWYSLDTFLLVISTFCFDWAPSFSRSSVVFLFALCTSSRVSLASCTSCSVCISLRVLPVPCVSHSVYFLFRVYLTPCASCSVCILLRVLSVS